MSFSIEKWLDEVAADGSLSPEERTAALKALGKDPKIAKRIEEGQLRQSDYSRKQEELRRKETETTQLIQANSNWKREAEGKLAKAQADLESERTTRAQYEAKIRTIASEYGLDEKELLPAPAATPAPATTTTERKEASPDYVTREVFERAADVNLRLPAAIADLAAEHQELFGKPLKGASELVSKAISTGKTLRSVWEEANDVQNRRDTLAREAQEAHDEKVRSEERAKILSETHLPVSRPDAPRSPIFSNAKTSENSVNSQRGVAAAMRSFNQGTYRNASQ